MVEKILIKARGGTPEQRAALASLAKDMKDVDIDFLNIDGVEGEMVLDVKTACGEAEAKCSDIQMGGPALESIISKVKCPLPAPISPQPIVSLEHPIIPQPVVQITPIVTEVPMPTSIPVEKKEEAPNGVQAN